MFIAPSAIICLGHDGAMGTGESFFQLFGMKSPPGFREAGLILKLSFASSRGGLRCFMAGSLSRAPRIYDKADV